MQETGIYGTIVLGGIPPKRRSLMYLDFLVKIPFVQGKITRRKKKDAVYVEYEYDRIYDPVEIIYFSKRVTIGKLSETDPELMQPNQNFLKYFRMQSFQRKKQDIQKQLPACGSIFCIA
ncbi:MAG: hypothetical protein ACLS61_08970 [Ruminococcus sp.]